MTKTRLLEIRFAVPLALIATLVPAAAFAKSDGPAAKPYVQPVQPLTLADNVVVTPNATPTPGQPAPAQPAPQAAPVVVTPQSTTAPAAAEPRRTNTVIEREPRSYVGTIFVSTLLGGLAGALIGASIWYLADDQTRGQRIGYWAAGGVLVGGAIGVTQVMIQESRVDRSMAFARDPVPTYRLALATVRF